MNKFGLKFTVSTFGESHGAALGCIVDGVPAGLEIDEEYIQSELDRRKPGKSPLETGRKEEDKVAILSGTFGGLSTGTPIAMIIYNGDQKSKDYDSIKNLFRPAHADYTYQNKYGIRDYRGGGRSSARETAARVAAGAVAKLLLEKVGTTVNSGVISIGSVMGNENNADFAFAKNSLIYALDKEQEKAQIKEVENARDTHDSVGGSVLTVASGVPIGLGEPMYHKLDGAIAGAMMGINAAKAVEIGSGATSARLKGSQNNDKLSSGGFKTNHSGGILGGISNGDNIIITTHFKPTPSIFQEQDTIDIDGNEVKCNLKGRHDPCVAIRGVVVCEAMMALVLADMLLLNMSSRMDNIEKVYGK